MLQQSLLGTPIQTQQIEMKLRESKLYWSIKSQFIQAYMQSTTNQINLSSGSLKHILQGEIHRVCAQMGLEDQLKQLINNFIQKEVKHDPIKTDTHDFLNNSRMKWTELLYKNYVIVYEKSKREDEDETSRNQSLYLYDEKNLLTFMQSIKSQQNSSSPITSNKLIQINLKSKSLMDLKRKFECLTRSSNLGFLSDEANSTSDKILEKQRQARRLIDNEVMENEIEKFIQEGAPSGDRSELYQRYFDLEGKESTHQQLFKKSEKDIEQNPSFFDEVMELDSLEVLEDGRYFVFKENIQTILKVLIRDKNIKEQLSIHPHNLDLPFDNEYGLLLPQCGFFPSKNIAKYIAPFCYLALKNHMIYALFTLFFCKYFCFLHSLSSNPNSILSISLLFEDIMAQTQNKLMHHLREIGSDALRVVLPMMQFIFIGHLDTEQVFYILDRVVGFQGTEILAIIAAGIMILKRDKLMTTKCQLDVETILSDLSEENTLELIQLTLNLI